jgi:hypothetical protein
MSNGNGDDQSRRAQFVAAPGPGPTQEQLADMPSAQLPPAPASNWDQIVQNADPRYTGKPGWTTTVFATPKDLRDWAVHHSFRTGDNGIGSAALGAVDTAHSYGVAVPADVMTKLYGGRASDPSTTANWRTARAQVTVNGKTFVVPISDVGPDKDAQTPEGGNRSTDLTSDLAKGIPGWMSDDSDGPVQIKLLPPGSGPDYLKNRPEWDAEQQNIGKQLTPTPLGSSDIVNPPQYQNPTVPPSAPDTTPVRRAQPVQTFQNPASGDIEPVQTFAKGGFVQPIEPTNYDESDDAHYTGPSLGGHFGAVNA